MFNAEPVDYDDPRTLLEAEEQLAQLSPYDVDTIAMGQALGRMLAWLFKAPRLREVGFRAYIMAHKIEPSIVNGLSFDAMSKRLGRGRSSAQKISDDFARKFGVRGPHDKSDAAREKYRKAWRRRNIIPCLPPSSHMPQANGPSRLLPSPAKP